MSYILKIQIFFIAIIHIFAQAGRKLGDECIPGMCSAINSNCKWNGNLFKCVCKEKFLAVNQTHCGHPISNIEEQKCRNCLEKDSLCVDFDNDGITDECWCPKDENCNRLNQPRKSVKSLENVDLSIMLIDAINNRPIVDGNSVFLGDQVIIDIKTIKKEQGINIAVENCSVSAISNSEDIFVEKIDLIKRGCPVQTDLTSLRLNFRSISESHIESNVFEIFRLHSSSTILINCFMKICSKKCLSNTCEDSMTTTNQPTISINARNFIGRNFGNIEEITPDGLTFKDISIRVVVEDPYGLQHSNQAKNNNSSNNFQIPTVIELEFKSKPFSGLIKSAIVSVITIVFAVFISITSILVYRACVRDQSLNVTRSEPSESVCQTSESCKYEMNARHIHESFMHSQDQPTNQSNARW